MDIDQIAETAATLVVNSIATDAWSFVRTKLIKALGRGDSGGEEQAQGDLDGMNIAYNEASLESRPEVARELIAELRGQLKFRLRHDPSFAADFRTLVDEISSQVENSKGNSTVNQYGRSEDSSTFIQVGHDYRDERGK